MLGDFSLYELVIAPQYQRRNTMRLITNRADTRTGSSPRPDVRHVKALLAKLAISGFNIVRAPAKAKEAIAFGRQRFRQRLVNLHNQVSTPKEHES